MTPIAIRKYGTTIVIRMTAPRIEDAVVLNIRKESMASQLNVRQGNIVTIPPRKLSSVSISGSRRQGFFKVSLRTVCTFSEAIHDTSQWLVCT